MLIPMGSTWVPHGSHNSCIWPSIEIHGFQRVPTYIIKIILYIFNLSVGPIGSRAYPYLVICRCSGTRVEPEWDLSFFMHI